jgi:hypothetical protein
MADPTPQVGLPNAEYLEIKNVSLSPFNLLGWKISDATSTGTINTNFLLQPDSIVILCSNSNVSTFAPYGKAIGVTSFPSLDNDGDLVVLRSPQNRIIHAVAYTKEWYQNAVKNEGGWSLEIIDPMHPCGGTENWKASTHISGGTPGKNNSVNANNTDQKPPQLIRSYTTDSVTVVLVFDEPLDSASASNVGKYSINGLSLLSANAMAPLFNTVQIKLSQVLQLKTTYNITVTNITDCKGNTIGAFNKTTMGLPELPAASDLVINEILFNPKPVGTTT